MTIRSALPLLLAAGCTSAATGGDTLRTLDNCGTKVADGVPPFFKKFFRCADISMSGTDVVIKTVSLPPHRSAYYNESGPNWIAFDTQGGVRAQNPNVILETAHTLTIPAAPVAKGIPIGAALVDRQMGTSDEEYGAGTQGIALDGVPLYNATAAPGDDIAVEEQTFDSYDAHPSPDGTYHYHAGSPGPLEVLKAAGLVTKTVPGTAEIELFGVMCDGTFVLGCTELDGSTPADTDFDGQNGHVGDLKDKDGTVYFAGRYHTHVCRAKFTKHLYSPEIQYYQQCGA